MFGSIFRNAALAVLFLSSPAFAENPTITTGDSTWSVGRIGWPLQAAGGSGAGYAWTVSNGTLPEGLAIRTDMPGGFPPDATAGIIGVAPTPGTYTFTLQVKDSANATATKQITMKILGLVITCDSELADASSGFAYSKTITTAGASGNVTFQLASGQTLPNGLTLSSSGVISGTPDTPGDYYFLVNITDSGGSVSGTIFSEFHLYVSPMHVTSPTSLPNATQGAYYSQTIEVAGGGGGLNYFLNCCAPGWLHLDPATGVLSGTPDSPGFWAFTIDIVNSGSWHLRKHYQLGAVGVPAVLPNLSTYVEDVWVGEYTAQSLNASGGTPPYTWSVTSGALPAGMTVQNVTDPRPFWNVPGAWLVGTPTTLGLYTFTVRITDSSSPQQSASMLYMFRVSALSFDGAPNAALGAAYSQRIRLLGGSPPYTVVKTLGTMPSGLTLDSTGLVSGTPTETGNFWLQIRVSDNASVPNIYTHGIGIHIDTTPTPSSIDIQGGDLGTQPVNQHIQWNLSAWGGSGTYDWSQVDGPLPSGLSLSGLHGSFVVLTGTLTSAGSYVFRLKAADSANANDYCIRTFRMMVTPLRLTVPLNLRWGNVNIVYPGAPLTVTGNTGTVTWSVEPGFSLPDGMTLSPEGVLGGTPTTPGQYAVRLRATDAGSGASGVWEFTITIYPAGVYPPLNINMGPDLGTFSLGRFDWGLQASGGTGSGYAFSLAGGNLPPGLAIDNNPPLWVDSSGLPRLAGVATTAGTYTFTLHLIDSGLNSTIRALTIRFTSLVMTGNRQLADASVGVAYSKTMTTAGASGTVSFALAPGQSLPPNMSLSSSGIISGTPSTAGDSWFDILISDSSGTIRVGMHLYVSPMHLTSAAALPSGTQGTPYSQTIAVAGGTSPISYATYCCAPNWLSLNPSTGVLSGTPDGPGFWGFSVYITDSAGGHLWKSYQIGAVGTPLTLVSINTYFEDLTIGEYRAMDLWASGGTPPYSWTVASGSLPTGLSVRSVTDSEPGWNGPGWRLEGAATAAGDYTFSLQATDTAGSFTRRVMTLHVSPLTFDGLPNAIFGASYSENVRFLGGTKPYTASKTMASLPSGLTMNGTGLVSGTPTETGNFWFQVHVVDSSGTPSTYTHGMGFNVDTSPLSNIDLPGGDLGTPLVNQSINWYLHASGGTGTYIWTFVGGTLPDGLNLTSAPGPYAILSGTPTTTGKYSFTLKAAEPGNAANFAQRTFRMTVTPIQLTVNSNLGWTNVNANYSTTLTVTGNTGTVTWSVEPDFSLPDGMTLSPAGVLSGKPTTPGQYHIQIRATDPVTGFYASWGFDIAVYPVGGTPPVAITNGSNLGTFSIGPLEIPLSTQGGNGTYKWDLVSGTMPPGMALRTDTAPWYPTNSTAGVIGLATTTGTYTFTLKVESGLTSDTRTFTLRISPLTILDSWNLPEGYVGQTYLTHKFTMTGNAGPVTWSAQPGNQLPPGIAFSPTGELSGTPTTAGYYNFSIYAYDGVDTVSRGFAIVVDGLGIRMTNPDRTVYQRIFPDATLNVAYKYNNQDVQLAVTGATGTATISAAWLPPGLTLQPDGKLTGSPTQRGTYWFEFRVSDSTLQFTYVTYQLTIKGGPVYPPWLSGGPNGDFILGQQTEIPLWVGDGTSPYNFTVTGLPPGMFVRSAPAFPQWMEPEGAFIWGTPLAAGTYTVKVNFTDSSSPQQMNMFQSYQMRVVPLSPGNISPDNPMRGGTYNWQLRTLGGTPPYTWNLVSGFLLSDLTLNSTTGVMSGTVRENGSQCAQILSADHAGQTITYGSCFSAGSSNTTININDNSDLGWATLNQNYSRTFSASGAVNYTWSLESGTLPPGLNLGASDGVLSGTPTAAGAYKFLLRAADSDHAANYGIRQFRLVITPLVLTSNSGLGWTNVGVSFAMTPTVSGNVGAVSWSLAPGSILPPGLTLNPATGSVSGAPASAGRYDFTLLAADSATSIQFGFWIQIYPAGMAPPLDLGIPQDLGTFSVGRLTYELQASGGFPPYTYSFAPGTQIQGLRLQSGPPFPTYFSPSATGGLLGVLATPGTYSTVIRVTDSHGQTLDRAVTFRISPLVHLANDWLPRAIKGSQYTFTFRAAGGTGPYLWSIPQGSTLPPGFSSIGAESGTLSGIPTTAGTYNFQVQVTDSNGNSLPWNFNLEVMPFEITTASVLPMGTSGVAYSQTLQAAGVTVTNWSLDNGGLPGGLTLNPTTGQITGTPGGTFNGYFTVRATASDAKSSLKNFSLIIQPSSPQPLYMNMGPRFTDTVIGGTWWTGLYASGGVPPYTWAVEGGAGTLPPGLEFIAEGEKVTNWSAAGMSYLSGRPAAINDYTFTLRVTDSVGTAVTRSFSLLVSPLWIEYGYLPLNGTTLVYNSAYTQKMLGLGGTGSYTWSAEGLLPTGLALAPDGTVSGTPFETGWITVPVRITEGAATIRRNVAFNIAANTPVTLDINVGSDLGTATRASSYARDFYASGSPVVPPKYTFSAMSSLPPGCALISGEAQVTGAPARLVCNLLASGTFTFTLRVQDAADNIGSRTFTLRVTSNSIYTASNGLYGATVNASFSQRLIAFGAGTWSLASGTLPPGVTLASNGTLSGSPTTAGSYSFTLAFTDASGLTITRTFTMTVAAFAITDPGIIPAQAIMGEPFTYTFSATGGAKTWSLAQGSTLPNGMNLSTGGTLSGTCASEGNYAFVLQASDGTTTVTKRFSFVVRHKYPFLRAGGSPVSLGEVVIGQSFSAQLNNSGGVPPYKWTVAPGSSLPAGLQLISGADLPANFNPIATLLAGVPSSAGTHNFTMYLTDATGARVERTFTFKVSALSLAAMTLRTAIINVPYSQALTALGGTPSYTYAVTSGFLPPGLSLSTLGLISGTSSNTGSWPFTVRVTDGAGSTISRSYNLWVDTPTGIAVDITPGPALSDASLGRGMWTALRAYGVAPFIWSLYSGSLPMGFSLVPSGSAIGLDPNTAYISGRGLAAGNFTFTLMVQDGAGDRGYKTFTQRVTPLQVFPYGKLTGLTTTPMNIQLTATGGTGPYTFAPAPGTSLPLGLTLNSGGAITGTTAESGSYGISMVVTDSAGNSLTTGRTLAIYRAGAPTPLQVGSSDGINVGGETDPVSLNANALQYFLPDSGAPPYPASLLSGALPPGMALVSGAGLSGTYLTGAPTSGGTYIYAVRVSDTAGQSLDVRVSTAVVPLNLSPDPVPPASVGTPYLVTFVPTGGSAPYSLQLLQYSGLPPGLAFSGMTLSGNPATPGRYDVSFILQDSAGAKLRRNFVIQVDSAATPVKALSASPASIHVTLTTGSVPAPVPINITSGSAPLNFTASVAGIPGAGLSSTSGTTPQSLNLQLPNDLTVGAHYGVIEINSPQATNAPLGLRVAVTVVPPPPCTYTVSPATVSTDASGGSGSLNVNSPSYCNWSPAASDTWITITSSGSGTGNGTVTYSLSSNPNTSPRTGTITVGGQTLSITQFGSTCSFTIDPNVVEVPAAGGNGTIAVNASLADCAWSAGNAPPWVKVTLPPSPAGSGSVNIAVEPNPLAAPRSDTVTIAGLTLNINQSGTTCSVGLSSGGAEVSASGGTGSVNVTTNGCGYSTVEGPSWIIVTSGGSGPGSGTLNYSVSPSSSTQTRTGSLLIGGQPYQIIQAGVACSFTIASNNSLFGSSGGPGFVTVTPNGTNCGWTAAGGSSWLAITSGTTGTGAGQVNFNLAPNPSSQARSAAIVVAGQTVTINQAGVVCGYSLRANGGTVPPAGGTGAAGVISSSDCAWIASSSVDWLSITSVTGSGSGEAVYAAQSNPTAVERSGTLTVAGLTYTVTQAGTPCSYTLSSLSVSVGAGGGTAGFDFTASQTGCAPAAVSFADWISVSTSFSGTSGSVSFTAGANPLTSPRGGNIQLGDQIFTVNQLAGQRCPYSLNAYSATFGSPGGEGSILGSASAVCSGAPEVLKSPEITLGSLTQDPISTIWTQIYLVPQFTSFNIWVRVLHISFGGELFTVKQTSW